MVKQIFLSPQVKRNVDLQKLENTLKGIKKLKNVKIG